MGETQFFAASDIGGTFTDTVVADELGVLHRFKAPTTPEDPVQGVLATFELASAQFGLTLSEFTSRVGLFSHGTTVATNALIERRGAATAMIHTAGFGDTLYIMRGYKGFGLEDAQLKNYRMLVKHDPVIERRLVREVRERVDFRGNVLVPLDEDHARGAVRELIAEGAESFAVCLLWCTQHPEHEQRIAEIIREEAPDAYVTTSYDVLARTNEYARSVTTAFNAYLGPLMTRATGGVKSAMAEQGLTRDPLLMQSNGGVASLSHARSHPVSFLLSGPVGGVIGSRHVAEALGEHNLVTTDMGGTSFDVGLVVDGQPILRSTSFVDNQPLGIPTVAIETVGAGGGSIAYVEEGILHVGPRSAGAVPGPACYGRGGTEPTVTDADVVLGFINPETFLGGRQPLDRGASETAIRTHIAQPLGLSLEDAAAGIKQIVDARMSDLVRRVTVHNGHDPRNFALIAFGGAGPVHAHAYGADIGVNKVIIPITASVHSALGILVSDLVVSQERSQSFLTPPGSTGASAFIDAAEVNAVIEPLQRDVIALLEEQGLSASEIELRHFVDMHFRLQIHDLTVALPGYPLAQHDLDALVEQFITDYELSFGEGAAFTAAGVEFGTWRVVATGRIARPGVRAVTATAAGDPAPIRNDRVYDGEWLPAAVYDETALRIGASIPGPAVVELKDTNIVIGVAQQGEVDDNGNLVITTSR